MMTLLEFMAQRRSEIAETRAQLEEQLKEATSALHDLDREIAALDAAERRYAAGVEPEETQSRSTRQRARKTIKTMVVEILNAEPTGLTSADLAEFIHDFFDVDIERSSLSPQLSRLKDDGAITHDETTGKWHIKKESAPLEQTKEALW